MSYEIPTYETLSISIENQIAHVQLSRPNEFNAMNVAFWQELPVAVRDIDNEAAARVIVISSQGKHFTAGMDVSVFSNPKSLNFSGDRARAAENFRRTVLQLQDTFNALEEVIKNSPFIRGLKPEPEPLDPILAKRAFWSITPKQHGIMQLVIITNLFLSVISLVC